MRRASVHCPVGSSGTHDVPTAPIYEQVTSPTPPTPTKPLCQSKTSKYPRYHTSPYFDHFRFFLVPSPATHSQQ